MRDGECALFPVISEVCRREGGRRSLTSGWGRRKCGGGGVEMKNEKNKNEKEKEREKKCGVEGIKKNEKDNNKKEEMWR